MKEETRLVANKYSYVLDVITTNRYFLFKNLILLDNEEYNDYNIELLFNVRRSIYNLHIEFRRYYRNYKNIQFELINQFKEELKEIQYNEYETSLRPYFVSDIKNYILEFLCAN